MAIASAVVVPADMGRMDALIERLGRMSHVEVKHANSQGIAVLLDAGDVGELKRLSEDIGGWDGVMDFSLAYLNWE